MPLSSEEGAKGAPIGSPKPGASLGQIPQSTSPKRRLVIHTYLLRASPEKFKRQGDLGTLPISSIRTAGDVEYLVCNYELCHRMASLLLDASGLPLPGGVTS